MQVLDEQNGGVLVIFIVITIRERMISECLIKHNIPGIKEDTGRSVSAAPGFYPGRIPHEDGFMRAWAEFLLKLRRNSCEAPSTKHTKVG